MLSGSLLVFLTYLVLVLSMVSNDSLKDTCSGVKPLTKLNVSQLQGDWLTLSSQLVSDGRPVVLPTPPPHPGIKQSEDICSTVRIDYNSEDEIVDFLMKQDDQKNNVTLRVSESENARWKNSDDSGEQLLILSTDPDKYLIAFDCSSMAVFPNTLGRVNVISRYDSTTGVAAVNDRDLENLITEYSDILGIPYTNPIKFNSKCLESPSNNINVFCQFLNGWFGVSCYRINK